MNTGTKFELMQQILDELAVLKNKQVAIMDRISKLEQQNIQLADTQLEIKLDDLYEIAAMSTEKAKNAFSFFQQKMNDFANDNHLLTETV